VGPRAGLDAGARRNILCPCRGLNPDHPARSQTLYLLSYRGSSFKEFFFSIQNVDSSTEIHDKKVVSNKEMQVETLKE
jgi:hypothetical protein